MTDEVIVKQKAVVATAAELAAAREARNMSQVDISQRIKLQVRQVVALEEGRWDALPGRSFVRGALRSYAKLLDVDATPLLESVGGHAEPAVLPVASDAGPGIDASGRGATILWVIVGLVGAVGLVLYFGADRDPQGGSRTGATRIEADQAATTAPGSAASGGASPGVGVPASGGGSGSGSGSGTAGGAPGTSGATGGAGTAPSWGGSLSGLPPAPGAASSSGSGSGLGSGSASGSGSGVAPAPGGASAGAGAGTGSMPPGAGGAGMQSGGATASGAGAAAGGGSAGGSPTIGAGAPGAPAGSPPSAVTGSASSAGAASAGSAAPSVGTAASPATGAAGAAPGAPAAAAAAGSAASSPDSAARGAIRFNAVEDSWIEVRQADGAVLHQGTVKAGSTLELNGTPPYRVTAGNPSRLQLVYEGKPRDLAPHTARNIARMTLP